MPSLYTRFVTCDRFSSGLRVAFLRVVEDGNGAVEQNAVLALMTAPISSRVDRLQSSRSHNQQSNETQIWRMDGGQITGRFTVVDEQSRKIFVGLPWSIVGTGTSISGVNPGRICQYLDAPGTPQVGINSYGLNGRLRGLRSTWTLLGTVNGISAANMFTSSRSPKPADAEYVEVKTAYARPARRHDWQSEDPASRLVNPDRLDTCDWFTRYHPAKESFQRAPATSSN
jgi:hypothetical protein